MYVLPFQVSGQNSFLVTAGEPLDCDKSYSLGYNRLQESMLSGNGIVPDGVSLLINGDVE